MTGVLLGRQYRVVGRVVLGEEEAGATYYWNEFNLQSDTGDAATLVYEVTERGGEWRLFRMFEPRNPLTAAEAAAKRLGDPLNLEGTPVFVRLMSTSRVYDIEGQAPEGVEVGDIAHYFNALGGDIMIVVSWTGEEVEFYQGHDLTRATVSAAFNVRIIDFSRFLPMRGGRRSLSALAVGVAVVMGLIVFAHVGYRSFAPARRPAVVRTAAPPSSLLVGKSGKLGATRFQVDSHLLVEVAMVGRKFDRHEYLLSTDEGAKALLVRGSKPGAGDWWLLQPLQPSTPLPPQQAAAVRWGQTVNVDRLAATVGDLFQSTIRQVESPEASALNPGDVFFGFSGTAQSNRLLARWNASYINFFQGEALQEKDVLAAFGRQPGN